MADKTYKMTVALSNGSTVDAGTFVAPQGPQGVKGDTGAQGPQGLKGDTGQQGASGAINDWQDATLNTVLADGTYIICMSDAGLNNYKDCSIVNIINGESVYFCANTNIFVLNSNGDGGVTRIYAKFENNKIGPKVLIEGIGKGGGQQTISYSSKNTSTELSDYLYILLKTL